jgi:FixJ family two-component response regulator
MNKKVLILDDDKDVVNVIGDFLEILAQCKTVRLQSYEEMLTNAIDVLECDIVLLDVNLGPQRASGIDCYHWLKDQGCRGRIYFLTGHALTNPLVLEASRVGAARVIAKPIDGKSLIDLVSSEPN